MFKLLEAGSTGRISQSSVRCISRYFKVGSAPDLKKGNQEELKKETMNKNQRNNVLLVTSDRTTANTSAGVKIALSSKSYDISSLICNGPQEQDNLLPILRRQVWWGSDELAYSAACQVGLAYTPNFDGLVDWGPFFAVGQVRGVKDNFVGTDVKTKSLFGYAVNPHSGLVEGYYTVGGWDKSDPFHAFAIATPNNRAGAVPKPVIFLRPLVD